MKARLTTVLSLGGVLFAGSAAALVNTEVLRSSGSSGGFGSEISVAVSTPSKIDGAVATTVAATGDVSTTQVAGSVAPAASQAVYQIGEAGLVTLDTAGDVLTVVSAVPSPGWAVVAVENDDASNIEVTLQSGTALVEFRANLLFGVVGTSVESSTLADAGSGSGDGSGSGNPTAPPVTTARPASPAPTSPPVVTTGTIATAPTPVTTDHHGSGGGNDDDADDDGGGGHDDGDDD
jgi:hypothetical protein